MNSLLYKSGCLVLLLSLCLWNTAQAQQQRSTGNRSSTQNRSTGRSSSYGNSGSSRSYNNNTMVGDATITSDPETRRIIVVTDDETAANISQVISNLDRPKPQVLIKIVFLEVAHNNSMDIGFEGGWSKNIGDGNVVALTNIFGLASQGANAGSFVTTPGAGIYQVVGNDFSATLRAIAAAGKTEVLSKPSILVRNNQTAKITVGQYVPLITDTRFDNYGNQINSVDYEDVGIILVVTPFITSEGLVQMIVAPEISSLSDQTVSIASGVNVPIINKRSANTVVVTPDGQTVVIGGLMQNGKLGMDSKIPFLGDIPWVGNLFKRKQSQATKTELVIFLTPYVVQNPGRMAASTAKEAGSLELAPNAFTEKQLNTFLEGMPIKKEVPEKKKKK